MKKNPWTTLNIQTAYENPWIKVTHRDVLTPSNTEGIYGLVHFKNLAIGIIPLDDEYNTWLVGQYRYTLEEYSWEIPEGGCPLGTAPLDSAKRELLEETGIQAERWTKILDMTTSNSVTDERGMTFIAQGLHFGQAMPEDTEELEIRKLPFAEALDMVMRGEITDSLSMVSLLKTQLLIQQGSI
ncbi:MAG: NUDIX hydrolase [Bacteroidota bacterium]